jgi:hypothetical protein
MKHFRLVHDTARKGAANYAMTAPEGWAVIFAPAQQLRSMEINAAYWAYLHDIADSGLMDDQGQYYTVDRLHRAMKLQFLGRYMKVTPSGVEEVAASTTWLKHKEFGEYFQRVQAFLTQLQAGCA